jgi:Phytanoyl-CoA dioxygenase (PhyH)
MIVMPQTQTTQIRDVTADEIAHFQENGWVKLESFIDPAMTAALLERAEDLMGPDGTKHADEGRPEDVLPWQDYLMAGRAGIEPVASVVQSREIGKAAWELGVQRPGVGVRYWLDRLTCRQPVTAATAQKASPTYAHQDGMLMFDRTGYVNFWVALNEIPPERGSMRFYSRSNREGVLGAVMHEGGFFGDILELYPQVRARCPVSPPLHLRPGDATAHGPLTVHEAPTNTTDVPRWAMIGLYFAQDARYVPGPGFPEMHESLRDGTIQPGQELDSNDFPVIYQPD